MSLSTDLYRNSLLAGAAVLGVTLSEQQTDHLLAYLALLVKWNRTYNLTAIRDPEEMISRHLLDSLSTVASAKQGGASWLDVGSGGGMPGIPLAILFPEKCFTLLDANGKKTRFLTQVKLELALDNLDVINARVENFRPGQAFSDIISRAFSSLGNFTGWTRHLGGRNTRWLAMKGPGADQELQALSGEFFLDESLRLNVPDCQGERYLLILRRNP